MGGKTADGDVVGFIRGVDDRLGMFLLNAERTTPVVWARTHRHHSVVVLAGRGQSIGQHEEALCLGDQFWHDEPPTA